MNVIFLCQCVVFFYSIFIFFVESMQARDVRAGVERGLGAISAPTERRLGLCKSVCSDVSGLCNRDSVARRPCFGLDVTLG